MVHLLMHLWLDFQDQILLLEEELLEVRARIKLFENRRIPNARLIKTSFSTRTDD